MNRCYADYVLIINLKYKEWNIRSTIISLIRWIFHDNEVAALVFALVAYAAHYRVRKIAERRVVIARRDSSRQVVMRIAPYITSRNAIISYEQLATVCSHDSLTPAINDCKYIDHLSNHIYDASHAF